MTTFRPTLLSIFSYILLFLSVSARPPQTPLENKDLSAKNFCYLLEIFPILQGCRKQHHCDQDVVTETCTITKTKTKTKYATKTTALKTTTELSTITIPGKHRGPRTETLTTTIPGRGGESPITKIVTVTHPGRGERGPGSGGSPTNLPGRPDDTVAPDPTLRPPTCRPGGQPVETTTEFVTITESPGGGGGDGGTITETETSTEVAIITIITTETETETSTEFLPTFIFETKTETVTSTDLDTVTIPVTATTTTTAISVSISLTISTLTTTDTTTVTPPPPSTTVPLLPECTCTLNFDNLPIPPSFFGPLPPPSQLCDIVFENFLLFAPPRGAAIPALSPPNCIIRRSISSPMRFVSADPGDLFELTSFAARCSRAGDVSCDVTMDGYDYGGVDGAARKVATGIFTAPEGEWGVVEVEKGFEGVFRGLAFLDIRTDAFLVLDDVVISRRRAACPRG